MAAEKSTFSLVDYVVFFLELSIPTLIGIYYAWKDHKNPSTNKYFFGGKKMNPTAVGISSAVTSISAITMIGYPAEVYLVGTVFLWIVVAVSLATVVTTIFTAPFFRQLQLSTVYEYLELRFNSTTRRIVAAMQLASDIFYMGSVMYIPAVALNVIAPIKVNTSILLIAGICTFYTSLGGMKAVVWSDVMQAVFMISATVVLLVSVVVSLGGVANISSALKRGKRDTFLHFENFDISSRIHPLTLLIGQLANHFRYLGFNQSFFQRFWCCKTTPQAQRSLVIYAAVALTIVSLSIVSGFVLYAYFEGCDPVESGEIKSRDQAAPYMALLEFKALPGMSGMYVGAIFSGTLSTISSLMNGCSAVIVNDFIAACYPNMSERTRLIASKICVLGLGIVAAGFAFLISTMEQGVYKVLRIFSGAGEGAVLGIFVLGIFMPWANSVGTIIGGVTAYGIMLWISLGSFFLLTAPPRYEMPPISVDECLNISEFSWNISTKFPNNTTMTAHLFNVDNDQYTFDQVLYSLNFQYYVVVGCCVAVIVGVIASLPTGLNKPSQMDPKLFVRVGECSCLPQKVRKFFGCGTTEQNHPNKLTPDEKAYSDSIIDPSGVI